MARLPRYLILEDKATFHITWKCHNETWLLDDMKIKKYYYDLLLNYKKKYQIKIHSYAFLSNHIHLCGTLSKLEQLYLFMKTTNSLLAKKVNHLFSRKGQVILDRYKSPRIQSDRHLLSVMTYVDLNPVRASICHSPQQYPYSSYRYYAYGEEDPLLDPPDCYLELGATPEERQTRYREMVQALRKEDRSKREFTRVIFIGNPEWVIKRYEKIKSYREEKKKLKNLPQAFP